MIRTGGTPEPFDVINGALFVGDSAVIPGHRVMAALDEGERIVALATDEGDDIAALHMASVLCAVRRELAG